MYIACVCNGSQSKIYINGVLKNVGSALQFAAGIVYRLNCDNSKSQGVVQG